MIDIEKHAAHWRDGAREEWEVACELLERGRIRHGLFLAHLALEKALKAQVCRHTGEVPPRIHNLPKLATLAGVNLGHEQSALLAEMNAFCQIGRYPGMEVPLPGREKLESLRKNCESLLQWLTTQY
ncbi:MAG: HEPN domain-containing protein [Candidatus Hydrogenedentes bacterium]|nr:HEPN domain-containing protein [Candidatus Hydrogenedentota bacterium]